MDIKQLLTMITLSQTFNYQKAAEQLQYAVSRVGGAHGTLPPPLQLLTALEIWREAGLLAVTDRGERLSLQLLPATGKTDLTQMPLWKYLSEGGQT